MRIRSKWLTKRATWVIVTFMKFLFATCRKKFSIHSGTNGWDRELPGRFVYGVWHDVLFFPLLMAKPQNMSALTSRHHDGGYVAETLRMLNIEPFRGSTNRGGAQVVRQLLESARQRHITITPDGPRGPRRIMKDGIVYLASRTGHPVVMAAFGCRRGLRLKAGWTDLLIPLPFTTAYSILGEPIAIPPDLSRDEIEHWTQRVQEAMDELYARLDDWIAGRRSHAEPAGTNLIRDAA